MIYIIIWLVLLSFAGGLLYRKHLKMKKITDSNQKDIYINTSKVNRLFEELGIDERN